MNKYYEKVKGILEQCFQTQQKDILKAAECGAQAVMANKQLFFFGTGHSHMLAEEVYYRAGGLKNIKPILESALMLHEGGTKSTRMERLEDYAAILLDEHKVEAGDVLFIISNSGLNAVPIEMAIGAKARGVKVVALTNLNHSAPAKPRHRSGKKLYEIADIVIDNCGLPGDAAVHLDAIGLSVGPTSTVVGAFIVNAMIVQLVENLIAAGFVPQIYLSANVEEGDEHNAKMIESAAAERQGG
ncbi:SIS domain-containing protein [Cohnella silvisoli]|uniref:SIS domain-containing protein n=1 Tax=Cohnella silvisoli TaxID=2873699 RepID=A0ABV1KRJ3_9BACL|nr:SIS domain-containing protein [Cohnella silvisoli]MCD9022423.1 SIS domain-containing protein [Cohnella silvisoli]